MNKLTFLHSWTLNQETHKRFYPASWLISLLTPLPVWVLEELAHLRLHLRSFLARFWSHLRSPHGTALAGRKCLIRPISHNFLPKKREMSPVNLPPRLKLPFSALKRCSLSFALRWAFEKATFLFEARDLYTNNNAAKGGLLYCYGFLPYKGFWTVAWKRGQTVQDLTWALLSRKYLS